MVKEQKDFRSRHLIFIDLETSGLNRDNHEILEVGCIVVNGENFEIIEEYSAKVKPSHIETATSEALKINGYTKEKWRDAKNPKEVLKKISEMSEGGMVAGWNVSFDWAFIEQGFKKYGIRSAFNYHKVDVQSIAYAYLYRKKKAKSLRLDATAELFGMEKGKIHGAQEDIRITYELFKKFMKVK
jgi:DNA polymerase III alpha subunit (gram-positive type)